MRVAHISQSGMRELFVTHGLRPEASIVQAMSLEACALFFCFGLLVTH